MPRENIATLARGCLTNRWFKPKREKKDSNPQFPELKLPQFSALVWSVTAPVNRDWNTALGFSTEYRETNWWLTKQRPIPAYRGGLLLPVLPGAATNCVPYAMVPDPPASGGSRWGR